MTNQQVLKRKKRLTVFMVFPEWKPVFTTFFCFLFLWCFVNAQVPQKFSYQAVARNNGEVLKNTSMGVRLTILQGSETGPAVWTETQTVTTNDFGLFSIAAGSTTPVDLDWSNGPYYLKVETDLNDGNGFTEMGTAQMLSVPYALYGKDADADTINEIQDLHLSGNLLTITKNGSATAIDLSPYLDNTNYWVKSGNDIAYDGGKVLIGTPAGNTQLEIIDAFQAGGRNLLVGDDAYLTDIDIINTLGVYGTTDSTAGNLKLGSNGALLSGINGNLGIGTIVPTGKLEVQGDVTEPPEKPLLEVKRHDGQTVFAVYNDSIRMYVNASSTGKGTKGGFAIGGFGAVKGSFQDYLRVTPDSVRVYIDQSPTKGPKGGFAIGGFGAAKGNTTDLMHLDKDNYFIGHQSGEKNTTGLYNQFFGYQAGMNNSTGSSNIFMGYQSGFENISGNNNVFIGNSSGYNNTGNFNTFLGYYAGYSLTNTSNNLIMGYQAGRQAAGGSYNVILGSNAGNLNNGNYNIFIGYESGYNNIGGADSRYSKWNTFIGYQAGKGNTTGWHNLCIGYLAGLSNQTATNQFFIGNQAGQSLTAGYANTFVGHLTGMKSTDCNENTFIGYQSGYNNLTGHGNTYIGNATGINATGSGNVFIGNRVGWSETGDNKLYIDNSSTVTPLIWGDFTANDVTINGNLDITGTLTYPSDIRLKKDITEFDHALEKIKEIKAVRYFWDFENHPEIVADDVPQLGVIAQNVQTIIPELVKTGPRGYLSVDYIKMTVVLLEAIKEQQKIIESQGKEIENLKSEKSEMASLKQQIEELQMIMGVAEK
ncbi:MAG: tail fiber domain-containing protein [Chlorobi bacterium]|nr:tail fiber domain-containing protein [Chlorobiota bacterium]